MLGLKLKTMSVKGATEVNFENKYLIGIKETEMLYVVINMYIYI